MKDWIIEDLESILKDETLRSEFIKINDTKKMYDFCREVHTDESEGLYTEDEFMKKVDDLINQIPEHLYEYDEW